MQTCDHHFFVQWKLYLVSDRTMIAKKNGNLLIVVTLWALVAVTSNPRPASAFPLPRVYNLYLTAIGQFQHIKILTQL